MQRHGLLKGFGILGSGLAIVLANAGIASANFTQVHKSSFGGKDKIFFPGQTAGSTIEVSTPKTSVKTLTLNNCGWGKFTESATSPVAEIRSNGVALSIGSGAAPTCTKAVAPATGYVDSNAGAAIGTAIRAGNIIWIKGGATVGAAVFDVDANKLIKVKVNACGFGSVTISPTRTMDKFSLAGTNYTLPNLPATTSGGLICRKDAAGNGVSFVPVGGF
jgi:hypothetical protein